MKVLYDANQLGVKEKMDFSFKAKGEFNSWPLERPSAEIPVLEAETLLDSKSSGM